jgi:hypothetical protein
MRRALLAIAAILALAVVAAGAALAHRRQVEVDLSPWPSADNAGPRGLAAAVAWLGATGRPAAVLAAAGDRPPPGAVVLLAAPRAPVPETEADALAAHAAAGGTVVWAVGTAPQPALERRLGPIRASPGSEVVPRTAVPLAPHPLVDGLVILTQGGDVSSGAARALPIAGGHGFAAAVSIPVGRGEVILLAGADALENQRVVENLSLWARLAARGPIAIDERFLRGAAAPPPGRAALALLAAQALLAGVVLVAARARRLGAIRPPPAGAVRTARDYLESLGALYRRTRSEGALAASAWARARRDLEARAAIPARLADGEAEARLRARAPAAAEAFARGRAALAAPAGPAALLAVVRAAADLDAALGARPRRAW